eukprot:CAMPEP_0204095354 /NCGR_PEP_ID=MMETSP0360-20130528/191396_1 /ASSEMBLY_ACC=CAM_ASM_000342 /TAXON_ID=268821 /ORGANISM="Scrippsiella Hangoei, Strain SHTV-5" /LENGTH=34 /DNA_ID= /DNA_START= /DNA_END= /DNA_ORIENTATION=
MAALRKPSLSKASGGGGAAIESPRDEGGLEPELD